MYSQLLDLLCTLRNLQGHSQDFLKAKHKVKGTHQIAMSFLPPVIGSFLKEGLLKGGQGHPMKPLLT